MNPTIEKIENCLPQTQCGLCEYAGCQPYATAIVEENVRIDRCLPGGVDTLREIGEIVDRDPEPYIAEMLEKRKSASSVLIREAECIGCTKCLEVCPVDAIVGAAKLMHTVIQAACTGCELCIPVCPIDCIDLIKIAEPDSIQKKQRAYQSKQRYQRRLNRIQKRHQAQKQQHQVAKLQQDDVKQTLKARQAAILEALARARIKPKNKLEKSS